jgi:hypothetical protein
VPKEIAPRQTQNEKQNIKEGTGNANYWGEEILDGWRKYLDHRLHIQDLGTGN